MIAMPEVCVDAWKRLRAFSHTRLVSIRRHLARRRLESNLALLVDAARGHEALKLSPGAPAYLTLHRQSEALVNAYCERWQVNSAQFNAELSALDKLRQLANNTPHQQARVATVGLIVVAVMLISFLLGVAGELVRLGYHLIGGAK